MQFYEALEKALYSICVRYGICKGVRWSSRRHYVWDGNCTTLLSWKPANGIPSNDRLFTYLMKDNIGYSSYMDTHG